MLWIDVAAAVIVLACLASLWGSYDTRRDMATGRPTYASLLDHTGIASPDKLAEHIGTPDDEGRYPLAIEQLCGLPQAGWKRYFDNDWVDIAAIAASVAGAVLVHRGHLIGSVLVLVAVVPTVVGYTIAVRVFLCHPQARESDD